MFIAKSGNAPLVMDSPHSGTSYPADFNFACDFGSLRSAEDTHVEKLFDFASSCDIGWVEALFPRSYLDVNRSLGELDPEMIDGHWPGPLETDAAALAKVRLGKGLVWKLTDDGVPIYSQKLSPLEVAGRIKRCWHPYHSALEQAIFSTHARHGWSVHLNCHSMPSIAGSHATLSPGLAHPDFVIGDRDGTSANPKLTRMVTEYLRDLGYTVTVNDPYKGVELVKRYSDPPSGRHSLQLEINRKLYMDETTRQLHAGSERLKRHLKGLVQELLALSKSDAQ